jgi:hypothetical protein
MVCNLHLRLGRVESELAGGEPILTRVTHPKGFFNNFTNENSSSSKLVVEIDQAEDYILDFHKRGR